MSLEDSAEELMAQAAAFAQLTVDALQHQRPEQHAALLKLMEQQGATLHVHADVHPIARVTAFLRIDGQAHELARVDLRMKL